MTNTLKLTPVAIEDIEYHKKSGNKPILRNVSDLLEEITENPSTGTGNPEEMKYNFAGCWSRRIIRQHRLVYRIDDETVTVFILQARGHYSDR